MASKELGPFRSGGSAERASQLIIAPSAAIPRHTRPAGMIPIGVGCDATGSPVMSAIDIVRQRCEQYWPTCIIEITARPKRRQIDTWPDG